jgi:hypothetical protein
MGDFTSKVDQAIAQFGGADEQKKLKLKGLVRDYMGYQNFSQSFDKANTAAIDPNLDGLSPTGIKNALNHDAGAQQKEVQHFGNLMDKTDSVANGIAAQKLADEKAGSAESAAKIAERKQQETMNPGDILGENINNYNDNPYDADGNFIPLDKFKESLKGSMGQGEGGAVGPNGAYIDEAGMNARVDARLGKDWDKTYRTQRYINQGYTKAEAGNMSDIDRAAAGEMGAHEYEMKAAMNPTWATSVQMIKQKPQIMNDVKLQESQTMPGTFTVDKPFEELAAMHPDVDPTKLAATVKPAYEKSLDGDIAIFFNKIQDKIQPKDGGYDMNLTTGDAAAKSVKTDAQDWGAIKDTKEVKNQISTLSEAYKGIFTPGEIEHAVYNAVASGKPVEWAKVKTAQRDLSAEQKSKNAVTGRDSLQTLLNMGVITKQQFDDQMKGLGQ